MTSMRHLLALVCAAALLANGYADDAPAPAPAPKAHVKGTVTNAVSTFKAELFALITATRFQLLDAIVALVLGGFALYDGPRFYEYIILFCLGAVVFFGTLTQLGPYWVDDSLGGLQSKFVQASILVKIPAYVASAEAGLFAAWAAWKGWEGTQVLISGAVGVSLYGMFQSLLYNIPHIGTLAAHPTWKVIVATLFVAFGLWALNDKKGAGRVLGVLCPIFGSSLVVSSLGYMVLFCATLKEYGWSGVLTENSYGSVFEFWWMMMNPFGSKAVGIFTLLNLDPSVGGTKISLDRVFSLFDLFLFAGVGIWLQLKRDRQKRAAASGIQQALLA